MVLKPALIVLTAYCVFPPDAAGSAVVITPIEWHLLRYPELYRLNIFNHDTSSEMPTFKVEFYQQNNSVYQIYTYF